MSLQMLNSKDENMKLSLLLKAEIYGDELFILETQIYIQEQLAK